MLCIRFTGRAVCRHGRAGQGGGGREEIRDDNEGISRVSIHGDSRVGIRWHLSIRWWFAVISPTVTYTPVRTIAIRLTNSRRMDVCACVCHVSHVHTIRCKVCKTRKTHNDDGGGGGGLEKEQLAVRALCTIRTYKHTVSAYNVRVCRSS